MSTTPSGPNVEGDGVMPVELVRRNQSRDRLGIVGLIVLTAALLTIGVLAGPSLAVFVDGIVLDLQGTTQGVTS